MIIGNKSTGPGMLVMSINTRAWMLHECKR